MAQENQGTIRDWREQTFGPGGSEFRLAVRCNEELSELLRCMSVGDKAGALKEAADVLIVLYGMADRSGVDIDLVNEEAGAHFAVAINMVMSNLLTQVANHRPYHEFIGDILVMLHGIVGWASGTLGTLVDDKMQINRARKWELDGSGHGYHIREK